MSFRNWVTDYIPINRGEVARRVGYAVTAELAPLVGRIEALERAIASLEDAMPEQHHPHDHDPVSHAQLRDRLHHYVTKGDINHRLHSIEAALGRIEKSNAGIYREVRDMSVKTDKLEADIATVAAGYQAVVARNAVLEEALASAGAHESQAVADAVAAEDADAQAKIDAADAVVAGILPAAASDGGSSDGGSSAGGSSDGGSSDGGASDGGAPADGGSSDGGNAPDNPPANPDDPTAPSA